MWLPYWIFSNIQLFCLDHFLLSLLFSILFIYAIDFYKRFPSFYFVYSVFYEDQSLVKKQSCAGFFQGLNSFFLGFESQRLGRKGL